MKRLYWALFKYLVIFLTTFGTPAPSAATTGAGSGGDGSCDTTEGNECNEGSTALEFSTPGDTQDVADDYVDYYGDTITFRAAGPCGDGSRTCAVGWATPEAGNPWEAPQYWTKGW